MTGRPHRTVPPPDEMKKMLNRGMTQQQIATAWGEKNGYTPSRSAVGLAIKRYNLKSATPRPRYLDLVPDGVKNEHAWDYNARMLRLEGRRRSRKTLKPEERKKLAAWKRQLKEGGYVVMYDPHPAIGWYWTPAEEGERPGVDLVRSPPD